MQFFSELLLLMTILFIFYRIIYGFYSDYKNEHNELIQKLKQDLIYLSPVAKDIIIYEGDQSYTYNKQKVYLCLYKKNGEQYPYDSLIYVAIHELAHVLCDETGHTEKFWRINNELIEKAKEKGIYQGSSITRDYCPLY